MDTLRECERDVEQARSKLANDLAVLRSPTTISEFTDSLKHKALETKDAVIEQAQEAVQSKLQELVEDLKGKVAANPAAALTIGAGVAWHFIRNPPIATALIGAGLFSLFRTQAVWAPDDRAYVRQGKARLQEQVSEFSASAMRSAKDVASDVQEAVAAKSSELIDTAKDKVQDWAQSAGQSVNAAGAAVQEKVETLAFAARSQAEDFASAARRARHDLADQATEAVSAVRRSGQAAADQATATAARVSREADGFVRDTLNAGRDMLPATDLRDKVLLGMAGIAVTAALGLAYQKRALENAD
jgi:hypothetical protein